MLRPTLFRRLCLGGLLAALGGPALRSADFRCASGPGRASLVELYTSEGCSSCPPADRWLEGLRGAPGLWREFVPVGFHVDYWDRLGWRDRFATKSFTQRQYALAGAWRSQGVYTPCFVRDGREWHPAGTAPARTADRPGVLAVALGADGLCHVRFSPDASLAAGPWAAHVALLGGGYASQVSAGENRGETLRHEFVALALADGRLRAEGGAAEGIIPVPGNPVPGAERSALAIWVTRAGSLEPIQATGGWLP